MSKGQSIGDKERTAAYRDGDRVGLVFVWAAWRTSSGVARTLLQTRSRPGDPYLGSLDAPAGGHIRAGEIPTAAAHREFAEEVGIALTPTELVFLGQQPLQYTGRSAMQFFYLCTRPISLGETVFNEEVGSFCRSRARRFRLLGLRTSSVNPRPSPLQGSTKRNKATGNYARSLCRLFRADHGRHPPLG